MDEKFIEERKKSALKIEILDFVRMILICFVFVFLCVKFVFRPVTVDGDSMYPTLIDQEYGFSNVFSTFISDPSRFEVVVVHNEETDKLWVKRVIGLPNETIEYKNDTLLVNGKIVKEDFLDQAYVKSQTNNGSIPFTNDFGPIKLKEGQYFLCGDNRPRSKDSRMVGPFDKDSIVSKHVIVIFPFNRMGVISTKQ